MEVNYACQCKCSCNPFPFAIESTPALQLTYLYSIIYPCACNAVQLFNRGERIVKIQVHNPNRSAYPGNIEKRYCQDELMRDHIETVYHCDQCKQRYCTKTD